MKKHTFSVRAICAAVSLSMTAAPLAAAADYQFKKPSNPWADQVCSVQNSAGCQPSAKTAAPRAAAIPASSAGSRRAPAAAVMPRQGGSAKRSKAAAGSTAGVGAGEIREERSTAQSGAPAPAVMTPVKIDGAQQGSVTDCSPEAKERNARGKNGEPVCNTSATAMKGWQKAAAVGTGLAVAGLSAWALSQKDKDRGNNTHVHPAPAPAAPTARPQTGDNQGKTQAKPKPVADRTVTNVTSSTTVSKDDNNGKTPPAVVPATKPAQVKGTDTVKPVPQNTKPTVTKPADSEPSGKVAETPKPTETPKAADTPKPTETPKTTETPKAADTPKPVATYVPAPTTRPVGGPGLSSGKRNGAVSTPFNGSGEKPSTAITGTSVVVPNQPQLQPSSNTQINKTVNENGDEQVETVTRTTVYGTNVVSTQRAGTSLNSGRRHGSEAVPFDGSGDTKVAPAGTRVVPTSTVVTTRTVATVSAKDGGGAAAQVNPESRRSEQDVKRGTSVDVFKNGYRVKTITSFGQ